MSTHNPDPDVRPAAEKLEIPTANSDRRPPGPGDQVSRDPRFFPVFSGPAENRTFFTGELEVLPVDWRKSLKIEARKSKIIVATGASGASERVVSESGQWKSGNTKNIGRPD